MMQHSNCDHFLADMLSPLDNTSMGIPNKWFVIALCLTACYTTKATLKRHPLRQGCSVEIHGKGSHIVSYRNEEAHYFNTTPGYFHKQRIS